MNSELWIYILIACILVISLIIIVAWTTVVQTPPEYPPAPIYSLTGFGMKCSDEPVPETTNNPNTYIPPPCSIGLICHGGFCLKDIGTSCSSVFECVPGTVVCNGYCSSTGRTGLNGQCSTNSDCDTSFVCDTSLVPAVCKRPGGSVCFGSYECESGYVCSDNVCVPQSNDGLPCMPILDADSCEGGNVCLSYGDGYYFCQAPTISAGGESSVCYYWNDSTIPQPDPPIKNITDSNGEIITVPSCVEGLQCNSEGNVFGIPTYGTCGTPAGWFDFCSNINGCQPPQVCLDGMCIFPSTVNESSLLILEPLSCENGISTGLCLNNYTCSTVNGARTCVGVGNGVPAITANSCNSGMGGYNVVVQTFQDIYSDPTDRLTTASWASATLTVPPSINTTNINQINFSTIETPFGDINAIFHIIGDNTYIISTPSGNINITISSAIRGNITVRGTNFFGKVAKVGYTTTGNYYCLIEYTQISTGESFTNLFMSTLSNFSDAVARCIPYATYYYVGTTRYIYITQYIYTVSVDDRFINPYSGFPVDVRIFITSGNHGPYSNNQFTQPGRLLSIRMTGTSLNQISQNLGTIHFNLLSYTLTGGIDSSIVWCQAFVSRTMDVTSASQNCLAYSSGSNIVSAYGPNPYSLANIGHAPLFPTRFYINFTMNQISTFNSRATDIFDDPCYYIANQGSNPFQIPQIYLGLTWADLNVTLPGDVDLNTLISVPFPLPAIDVPGYIPKITMLSRVCL